MIAKLNSKTHLQNTFFVFLTVSSPFDFKVYKCANQIIKKNFSPKMHADFDADFESVDKVVTNSFEKSYQ